MSVRVRRSPVIATPERGRGAGAIRSTTVIAVRDEAAVALAGDGQVTVGQ